MTTSLLATIPFGQNALIVLALMTALWIASAAIKDVSIVDPWWSITFLLVTANTARATGLGDGKALLLVLVAVWAVRLWAHLLWRSRGTPEDPRYADFRRRYGATRYWWVSFFQVFLLQGALAYVISAPLVVAAAARAPDPIAWNDVVGTALFVAGFACEAVADLQLLRFRRDPAKRGTILDTGVWRVSRHPNYFGEALLWWGFYALVLDEPWGLATVPAPLLMTFLLVRVSGVSMMDAHMTKTRPGYATYVARTPAFVPWWPRR